MVEVGFCIESNKTNVMTIAQKMNITSCEVRTDFPPNSYAVPYVYIKRKSSSKDLEENLKKIEKVILPHIDYIEKLLEKDLVQTSFIFTIRASYEERPEMVISSKHFRMFEKLKSNLIFDVAYE